MSGFATLRKARLERKTEGLSSKSVGAPMGVGHKEEEVEEEIGIPNPHYQDYEFSGLMEDMRTVLTHNQGRGDDLEDIASMLETLEQGQSIDVKYSKADGKRRMGSGSEDSEPEQETSLTEEQMEELNAARLAELKSFQEMEDMNTAREIAEQEEAEAMQKDQRLFKRPDLPPQRKADGTVMLPKSSGRSLIGKKRKPIPKTDDQIRWMAELKRAEAALAMLRKEGREPRPVRPYDYERYGVFNSGSVEYPGYVMPPPKKIPATVTTDEYEAFVKDWKDPTFWERMGTKEVRQQSYYYENNRKQYFEMFDRLVFFDKAKKRIPPYEWYAPWLSEKIAAQNAAGELVKAFKRAMAAYKDREMKRVLAGKQQLSALDKSRELAFQGRVTARQAWEKKMKSWNKKMSNWEKNLDRIMKAANDLDNGKESDELLQWLMHDVPEQPPSFEEEYVPVPRAPLARSAQARKQTSWMVLTMPTQPNPDQKAGRAAAAAAAAADAEDEEMEDVDPEERRKQLIAAAAIDDLEAKAMLESEEKAKKYLKAPSVFPYQVPQPSGKVRLTVRRWVPTAGYGTEWEDGAVYKSWKIPEYLRKKFPRRSSDPEGEDYLKSTTVWMVPDPVSMQASTIRSDAGLEVRKWDALAKISRDALWPNPEALARAIANQPTDDQGNVDPYEYLRWEDGTIMLFDEYGFVKPYQANPVQVFRTAAGQWNWLLPPAMYEAPNEENFDYKNAPFEEGQAGPSRTTFQPEDTPPPAPERPPDDDGGYM